MLVLLKWTIQKNQENSLNVKIHSHKSINYKENNQNKKEVNHQQKKKIIKKKKNIKLILSRKIILIIFTIRLILQKLRNYLLSMPYSVLMGFIRIDFCILPRILMEKCLGQEMRKRMGWLCKLMEQDCRLNMHSLSLMGLRILML